MSALFKFYTIPLLVLSFLGQRNRGIRILTTLLALLGSFLILSDLRDASDDIPKQFGGSFGNSIFSLYLSRLFQNEFQFSIILEVLIGLAQLLLTYALAKGFARTVPFISSPILSQKFLRSSSGKIQMYFIFVFITCYFAGMSYDYRIFFLIVACIIEFIRLNQEGYRSIAFVVFSLLTCWLSLASGEFQPFGDVSLGFLIVYFISLIVRSAIQNKHVAFLTD